MNIKTMKTASATIKPYGIEIRDIKSSKTVDVFCGYSLYDAIRLAEAKGYAVISVFE
jgi:hypothetical protein